MEGTSQRAKTRGQALVEFALVAPFLFLLLLGIIELGRLIYYSHTLNNAAREGARYAIVHGSNSFDGSHSGPMPPGDTSCSWSDAGVRNRVNQVAIGMAGPGLTFGWTGDCGFPVYTGDECGGNPCNAPGMVVTVHLVYAYAPLVLSDIFGTIAIRAESTLVINN